MSTLYDYHTEALDLALACRRALVAGDMSLVRPAAERMETIVSFQVGLREREHRGRTGASSRPLEEETQALLVATLRQDPLAWSDPCPLCADILCQSQIKHNDQCTSIGYMSGVVAVHHSPDGYGLSRFQAAASKRAGAGGSWPDLDVRLVTPRGPLSLLIELKAGKGRESVGQRDLRRNLTAAGFDVVLARGLWEALEVVLSRLMEVEF